MTDYESAEEPQPEEHDTRSWLQRLLDNARAGDDVPPLRRYFIARDMDAQRDRREQSGGDWHPEDTEGERAEGP